MIRKNIKVNGKTVSVKIRGLASGMGMDYIVSGKHVPDVYTPSNELWGEMIRSKGKEVTLADEKMLGNVAGVLMSKAKNEEIINKYGAINLKNITEAVANNEIAMGYTNPFASATGLNFLVSTLNTFDSEDILSVKAVEGFERFQTNIPLVSYKTLQMRESAESGSLDGFIMEYQTYINSPELKSDYIFTPFGVRHDSPVYEVGNLSEEKKAILNEFIAFYEADKYQAMGTEYGFNEFDEYKSEMATIEGHIILEAQKLWKEKKNVNKDISAVFVADVSGRMEGEPLSELKKSLELNMDSLEERKSIIKSIEDFGIDTIQKSSSKNSLLQVSVGDLSQSGSEGGLVAKGLVDLQREMKDIDPSMIDFEKKGFLGKVFNPLRQRIMDMQQMIVVNQQGIMAIEVIRRNTEK